MTAGSVDSSAIHTSLLSHKRPYRGQNKPKDGGEDSDDDEEDAPKRRKKAGSNEDTNANRMRLKCPYYQRQPNNYPDAACRGPGFKDMAKLK